MHNTSGEPLRPGFDSSDGDPAMISQPDALLAIEPAHLPHYTHPAVIVGSVIILAIITLMAGLTLAIAHHLASTVPITHRDQSPRLPCLEKHEMTGAHLNLTEHPTRSDPAVDAIPVPARRRGKRMGQAKGRRPNQARPHT